MPVAPAVPKLDDKYELNVAVRILNGPAIDLQAFELLVGQPRRYGELRAALKPKADMDLNRCLRRLLDFAVVDQVSDYIRVPPAKTYRLTPIGVQTFYTLANIRNPIRDWAEIARALDENRGVKTQA